MKITNDGDPITFREYLIESGGSGAIYDDDIQKMLLEWKASSWAEVDDVIGPISAQVIIDASELDRDLYNEIMTVIEKAYYKLKVANDLYYESLEVQDRRRSFHIVENKKSPS